MDGNGNMRVAENRVLHGILDIARECGVSHHRVREWMIMYEDFPARREGPSGKWLSTRRALLGWMDRFVTAPDPCRDPGEPEYPLPPTNRKDRPRDGKSPRAQAMAR